MKLRTSSILVVVMVLLSGCESEKKQLESKEQNVLFQKKVTDDWEVFITDKKESKLFSQSFPVQLEFYQKDSIVKDSAAYMSVEIEGEAAIAKATLCWKNALFEVMDRWSIKNNQLSVKRILRIKGEEEGGFMSSISLNGEDNFSREKAEFFAPGMIYGDPSNLTKTAIGGVETENNIWIREDRLPVPLISTLFKDGSAISVFNPTPRANTTQEDSEDDTAKTLVDNRFKFGALGVSWENSVFRIGFSYPGSEGEITYAGNTYPGGQMKKWRRRYHTISDGFEQNYQVIFRFTKEEESFPEFYNSTWRWAWEKLNPEVKRHDIAQIKEILLDMLGERAVEKEGRTGFPQSIMGADYEPYRYEDKATLGFVGKNLEASYFLLRDAQERKNEEVGRKHRQLAYRIIETFIQLPVSPPVSEGYGIDDGKPRYFGEGEGFSTVFLRSYGDDVKSLLKAIKFEGALGRHHDDWLDWAQEFGDWLLTQQDEDGGFPRAWSGETGEVLDSSTKTSYNPIPMFLLLTELTSDEKYKKAAIKAGEFIWRDGQNKGLFVGATIDNPDVIDKEAGTLSAEAYLTLYDATGDKKWVERASAAADFAQTWIYLWEIPPPVDNTDKTIGLKEGMTTIGNQLISSGHSLTDNYMAFDVDEYVQLYKLTGDDHYLDVAKILLHNTKSWIPLQNEYRMKGPGWQQEHWSLAPHRGHGMHRRWLPWVTTSHLNGIYGLQDLGEDINLDVE